MAEPEKQNANQENKGEQIKPLRTFEGDVAEILQQGKTSATQIAAAESEQARLDKTQTVIAPSEPINPERMKTLFIIAGAVVLSGAVGFGAYWYFKPSVRPAPPVTSTGQAIITIDLEKTIDLTGLTYKQSVDAIVKERDAAVLRVNSTEAIAFTVSDLDGVVTQLKTAEFLTTISPSIPQSLTRSLENEFAFGIIGFDGNQPFLILRTNSFENAYDGMLRGEIDFYREAGAIFVKESPLPGLSSSTRAYYGTDPGSQVFHDVVIKNIDTRAVKNMKGEIVFLYAFPDQATIVVTTNQKTFGELIEKLRRTRLIR